MCPMKENQTATVLILVEAGSKYENKKNNGISHFLEHMMFKGTKKRPKAKIISEKLDEVGAEYNAFTGKEQTGYWVKTPKNKINLALDVVSDLYLNPLLKEKDIEVEKGVILQELAMYQDMPNRYVFDVFENLLYGDQPAGWEIIGKKENISNFKREDFSDYMKKFYLPKNTVIVVSGGFEKDKILKEIEKSFSSLENSKKNSKRKTAWKQTAPKMKIITKKTEQTHLVLGFHCDDMFSENRYALNVLSAIMGGGMSSRMFLNIREKYGLTYYIGASTDLSTDSGYFFANAGVKHENLAKAIKLILDEFRKVKEKKVSKKELKKVKEFLKGKFLMGLESSDEVASFLGNQELFRKKIQLPSEIIEKLDAINEKDLLNIAKDVFRAKNLNLAVIGPHQKNDELKKVLTV